MWVFGYGSLMCDGWEKEFQGRKYVRAKLNNYRRNFNKSSIRNWGSHEKPGPTLGLEEQIGAECIGCAFEFEGDNNESVISSLREREGKSFELIKLNVVLEDGRIVKALTPIDKHNAGTYIGNLSIEERAEMAKVAKGTHGSCFNYIQGIRRNLIDMGIEDMYVEQMWKALQK